MGCKPEHRDSDEIAALEPVFSALSNRNDEIMRSSSACDAPRRHAQWIDGAGIAPIRGHSADNLRATIFAAHFPVILVVIAVAEFAKVGVALDKPALRLGHRPVGCATVIPNTAQPADHSINLSMTGRSEVDPDRETAGAAS